MRSHGFSTSRPSAARRWFVPAAAIIASLAGTTTLTSPSLAQDVAAADTLPPRAAAAVTTLQSPTASEVERLQAAQALLGMTDSPAVRTEIATLLAPPSSPASAAILARITFEPDAPPRLYPILAQRLAVAAPDESPALLTALSSFRTRDSVRLLARYLHPTFDERTADAAMSSLARLSARDDAPHDRQAWAAWAKQVDTLSDTQWRLLLISSLAKVEDRALQQRRQAVTELVETYRKLHLITRPEDRPALLASLLQNDTPEVRSLGFDLVGRELSASGHVDGPVGQAALALLLHSDPKVRSGAAILVRQLAPPGAEQGVATALSRETDPGAAADLLLAAARWPSADIAPSVLKWMDPGSPAFEADIEAAWWLSRAGYLQDENAAQALAILRSLPPEKLTPSGVSLLSALGDDSDREHLVPLMLSTSAAVRQAAGEALVWQPQFAQVILRDAQTEPELFELACRAVLHHDPTARGLRRVLELPHIINELSLAAILRTADGLPADDLLEVAREVKDPALKRPLLTLLTAPKRLMSEKADPLKLSAIAQGAAELADLQINEEQPDSALATLDNAGYADELVSAERLGSLRCTALVCLGQIEAAEAISVPIEAWLRALDLSRTQPFAPKIVKSIENRFGSTMTEDNKALVDKLKASLISESATKNPVGPVANPDPQKQ